MSHATAEGVLLQVHAFVTVGYCVTSRVLMSHATAEVF